MANNEQDPKPTEKQTELNLKKEKRRAAREEMMNLYAESQPENYFEEIDGEDFSD